MPINRINGCGGSFFAEISSTCCITEASTLCLSSAVFHRRYHASLSTQNSNKALPANIHHVQTRFLSVHGCSNLREERKKKNKERKYASKINSKIWLNLLKMLASEPRRYLWICPDTKAERSRGEVYRLPLHQSLLLLELLSHSSALIESHRT